MTTSGPAKCHFLVYAQDNADPETLQRRLSARSEHLGRAKSFVADGVFKVLGPTLTLDSALPGTQPKMNGSMFVAEASSIEEVKQIVESDVYYKTDVWDKEKIIITPMILTAPA